MAGIILSQHALLANEFPGSSHLGVGINIWIIANTMLATFTSFVLLPYFIFILLLLYPHHGPSVMLSPTMPLHPGALPDLAFLIDTFISSNVISLHSPDTSPTVFALIDLPGLNSKYLSKCLTLTINDFLNYWQYK
jgi:hypothetical protein